MSFNFSEEIHSLFIEEKIIFYEQFTYNLTIAIRAIWSNEYISDTEKLDRIKWVNEIMHQSMNKLQSLRNSCDNRTEKEMWDIINHWVSQNKNIAGEIGLAIKSSYAQIKQGAIYSD